MAHYAVTLVMADSSCNMICVFLAMRVLKGVGRDKASSNELVCSELLSAPKPSSHGFHTGTHYVVIGVLDHT